MDFSAYVTCRWIYEAFSALEGIAVALARHGPGLLPPAIVTAIERHYESYRSAYNSALQV